MIRGEVEFLSNADLSGEEIYFRINELGRLETDDSSFCSEEATGHEFNPLKETNKWGQLNPF